MDALTTQNSRRLGDVPRGFSGAIIAIEHDAVDSALSGIELERRLIEFGFVEGARVEVLHEGPVGGDPIAIRINGATVALRRREAMAIKVTDAS
ncbi:MAG: ferrous iron transport protein A [Rhizobiales bacterium]|nr:ferrous iron transport protein A [Hyphomicrobiales bacterium]